MFYSVCLYVTFVIVALSLLSIVLVNFAFKKSLDEKNPQSRKRITEVLSDITLIAVILGLFVDLIS